MVSGTRTPSSPAVMVLLTAFVCSPLDAAIQAPGSESAQAGVQAELPITAEELMPLELRRGVYLVTAGPETGKEVPFTFEPRGDHWLLTKEGLARHELHRDREGNLLIDRETDLREDRQIEYAAPILLLPSTVDRATSVAGTTRVTVGNTRARSVTYRGVCRWELRFIGVRSVDTPAGRVPVYRLRATREIRIPLAQISMTIDFEYGRGRGMVATGIKQIIRSLGLFTDRDVWRLEQR